MSALGAVLMLALFGVLTYIAPAGAQSAIRPVNAAQAVAENAPAPAASSADQPLPDQQAALKAAQEALIKASQNPVGNIAIFPLQNNWNYGYGPYQRTQYNLNIQPVVPIMLTPSLNLIARTIVPMVDQPSPQTPVACAQPGGCPWTFGVGDVQEQLFLAPKTKPGAVIWGAGPLFYLPTASPSGLGLGGKTSIGPTAVALVMPGPWVIGILANQAWSFMGPASAPSVSLFYVQPFVNYNFGQGWTLTTNPGITANWNAPGSNKWTVPVGGGISKTFKLGDQPQLIQIAYYANVVRPAGAAYGTWRFVWSLLFPVKR